jgi:hypothetical protein
MNPEQHEMHMQKIQEGLQAILQSNDINEIKQIAQSLLVEEQSEAQQGQEAPQSLKEKLMAMGGDLK